MDRSWRIEMEKLDNVKYDTFKVSLKFSAEQVKEFERNPRETLLKILPGPLKEAGIDKINGLSVPYELSGKVRGTPKEDVVITVIIAHVKEPIELHSLIIILPI